jgi:hypothetical protein
MRGCDTTLEGQHVGRSRDWTNEVAVYRSDDRDWMTDKYWTTEIVDHRHELQDRDWTTDTDKRQMVEDRDWTDETCRVHTFFSAGVADGVHTSTTCSRNAWAADSSSVCFTLPICITFSDAMCERSKDQISTSRNSIGNK